VKCIQRRKRHRIRSWSTGIFMLLIAIDYRKYYWLTRTTLRVPEENKDQDKNMKTKTPQLPLGQKLKATGKTCYRCGADSNITYSCDHTQERQMCTECYQYIHWAINNNKDSFSKAQWHGFEEEACS
jgi:hypothetical protein